MLSSDLSHLQCSISYPGENHVQDSDKDPRQDPIGSQRIVNMMLYNLAQDPGKSWTRLLSLTPYPPFPCYHKKITGRHRTLAAQIWAKFLN